MWYWIPWYALIIQSFTGWEPRQFRNPPGLDKNIAGMKDLTLWGDTTVYKWAFTGRGMSHPTSGALLNCWGYLIYDLKELSAESGTLPPTPVTDIDIININIVINIDIDIDIEHGVLTGLLCWTHSWDGDSFCWRWCNQEGEMLILSLNTDVPSPLGGWTDTQLIGVQIHLKEFESSSCKHTKLPRETAVEVLQGCKAHILPSKLIIKIKSHL